MSIKLFALPYAFGSSYIYHSLENNLIADYDMISLDYPGHGGRMRENLIKDIKQLADDAYKQICKYLKTDEDYAILGYSMGSIVGFEVLNIMKERKIKEPKAFFAFASPAPNRKEDAKDYENYNMTDIKNVLLERKGTPDEVLENEEMLELLEPIIRNDLIALRDYNDSYSDIKIECPLIVVRGTKENGRKGEDIKESFEEWRKFASGKTAYYEIEGEHFFMFENEKNLQDCCQIIKENI